MKVDFNKVLVSIDGESPLRIQGKILMVKDVCVTALLDRGARENLDETEFIHRYKWMLEIQQTNVPLEVSDGDMETLRRLLLGVQGYSVFVIGQVLDKLRGN